MWFSRFARTASTVFGHPLAFAIAVCIIVLWGISGPLFHFSDTWQLVINTGTTIVTFLMVFLIQNTQNRDNSATHIKLDEIVRVLSEARTGLVNTENMSEQELEALKTQFRALAEEEKKRTSP